MQLLHEAQTQVLSVATPRVATVSLEDALGHILSDDIISPQSSPAFNNSAMDGYALALQSSESDALAITRQRIDVVGAGDFSTAQITPETCVKIMTGAVLPNGANIVVPIEEAVYLEAVTPKQKQEEDKLSVVFSGPFRLGQHIRLRGEEFNLGELLLPAGTFLSPAAIGLLASLGYVNVPVFRVPRVAILATGSELLPVGASLLPGKLRDSNSDTLAACVREAGAIPVKFGILPDNPLAIKAAFEKAFQSCDMVLSSGGVSVGDFDYVQEILLKLGLQKKFWKVAIKPGKPVLFGTWEDKLCFGIPGNPASALVVFELLVRPALRQMLGHDQVYRPKVQGRLLAATTASPGRLHFMRAHYNAQEQTLSPFQGQGSSNLWTAAQANALLPIYEDYAAGDLVEAYALTSF